MIKILLIIVLFIIILFITRKTKYSIEEFIETFSSVEKFISEMNINYAIAYGTALGAYRNNDFISYVDDIDIIIFNEDIQQYNFKSLEDQQKYFNEIAKKYDLIPKYKNSAPFLYIDHNYAMPIMYQYKHKKTKLGVDFYIFYKYKNNYWNFCEGGERDFKGLKYPINKPFFRTKLNKFDVISCPIDYLHIMYGKNLKVPMKKGEQGYYHQEREYFGKFPSEWLILK